MLGQPAADQRPQQGAQEDRQAEGGHADRLLVLGQAGGDDGLGGGDHRPAGKALPHPADDHPDQGVRRAADHRKQHEQQGAAEQHVAQAEQPGQPGGQRDHHDLGDQIAGADPGALGAGGADLALDLRQS